MADSSEGNRSELVPVGISQGPAGGIAPGRTVPDSPTHDVGTWTANGVGVGVTTLRSGSESAERVGGGSPPATP
ncbi:hypothetical protein [Nocardia paucivorans]|uniref:hypothetical protein n=1 Tax=Nocardia paucivorans TaxID=114259 RepID=UPI0002D4A966|nr:hypothetical protein [Nocardia paucivorans]